MLVALHVHNISIKFKSCKHRNQNICIYANSFIHFSYATFCKQLN